MPPRKVITSQCNAGIFPKVVVRKIKINTNSKEMEAGQNSSTQENDATSSKKVQR